MASQSATFPGVVEFQREHSWSFSGACAVKENEIDTQTEAEKRVVSVLVVFKSLAGGFLSLSFPSDLPGT